MGIRSFLLAVCLLLSLQAAETVRISHHGRIEADTIHEKHQAINARDGHYKLILIHAQHGEADESSFSELCHVLEKALAKGYTMNDVQVFSTVPSEGEQTKHTAVADHIAKLPVECQQLFATTQWGMRKPEMQAAIRSIGSENHGLVYLVGHGKGPSQLNGKHQLQSVGALVLGETVPGGGFDNDADFDKFAETHFFHPKDIRAIAALDGQLPWQSLVLLSNTCDGFSPSPAQGANTAQAEEEWWRANNVAVMLSSEAGVDAAMNDLFLRQLLEALSAAPKTCSDLAGLLKNARPGSATPADVLHARFMENQEISGHWEDPDGWTLGGDPVGWMKDFYREWESQNNPGFSAYGKLDMLINL